MEGGGARGERGRLCLQILLFLNSRSVVYFCGWGLSGRTQNLSFFEDVINAWLLIINNK